jgi:hypothetical protein
MMDLSTRDGSSAELDAGHRMAIDAPSALFRKGVLADGAATRGNEFPPDLPSFVFAVFFGGCAEGLMLRACPPRADAADML